MKKEALMAIWTAVALVIFAVNVDAVDTNEISTSSGDLKISSTTGNIVGGTGTNINFPLIKQGGMTLNTTVTNLAVAKTGATITGAIIPSTDKAVKLGNLTKNFETVYTQNITALNSSLFIRGKSAGSYGGNIILSPLDKGKNNGINLQFWNNGSNTRRVGFYPDITTANAMGMKFHGDTGLTAFLPFSDDAYSLGTSVNGWDTLHVNTISNDADLTLDVSSGEVVTSDDVVIGGTANIAGEALTVIKSSAADGLVYLKNTAANGVSAIFVQNETGSTLGQLGYDNGGNYLRLLAGSGQFGVLQSNGDTVNYFKFWNGNVFSPSVDSNLQLGTNTEYFSTIYTDNVDLSAVAQVGADPMCWDGSGATKIGDCTSSASVKHDIVDSPFGIETVMKLRPRTFKLNSNNQTMVGFIAEETAETVPILVGFREDGTVPKTVYYEYSTAILTKAIQEQQTQIELLQTELCNKDNSYKFCEVKETKNIPIALESKLTYYRVNEYQKEQAKKIAQTTTAINEEILE